MHRLVSAIAALVIASTFPGSAGCAPADDDEAGDRADDDDAGEGATGPVTCAEMASELCDRAAACGNGETARVRISARTVVSYASVDFCTQIFTTQCGPDAPASFVPLVRDPTACRRDLDLEPATCLLDALTAPTSCGFRL